MAKKKSIPFSDYEFKSVYFNKEERLFYERWIEERKYSMSDVLTTLTENDIKVSISYDKSQSCALVSITFKNPESTCAKVIHMFRHSDVEKAVFIAAYYVTEILNFGDSLAEEYGELDW